MTSYHGTKILCHGLKFVKVCITNLKHSQHFRQVIFADYLFCSLCLYLKPSSQVSEWKMVNSLFHCILHFQIKKAVKRKAYLAPLTTSAITSHEMSPVEDHSAPSTVFSRRGSGRPIKPPKKDLPGIECKKARMSEQLRCCNDILKEMFSKRHYAYAWPFYTPVDAVALGLHDYHDIIKQPMDLSTIKVKLLMMVSKQSI